MAQSDKIDYSSLFKDKDIFNPLVKSADEATMSLMDLAEGFKLLQAESTAFLKKNKDPKTAKELTEVNSKLKESILARKSLQEVEKLQIKLDVEREKLKQAQIKTDNLVIKQIQQEEREKEKQLKQQEKELANLKKSQSAYSQASKQLNELRQRYKDLAVEGKANTTEAIRYLVEITKLDRELKEIDASVGQFNRSVGDYSNQVQDAIEKTGFFGDIIGKITQFVELFESVTEIQSSATKANTVATELNTVALETNIAVTEAEILTHEQNVVALQAETVATEKLSLAKRVLNAITSPIGVILLAVGAVVALTKAVYDVNQATQDWFALKEAKVLDATRSKLQGYTTSAYDHTKAVIDLRKETNSYLLKLAELKDAEGDLTEISNDSTLSFGQRQEAFKKANQARIDLATIELDYAKKELAIADLAVKKAEDDTLVKKGQALNEVYLKQAEARVKAFEAEDALGDLTRTNAEKERQIIQTKTSFEVDLILKKKENAFASSQILEESIAKETASLKNRRKLINELNKEERKNQKEQFKAFNEGIDAENKVNAKAGEQLKKRVNFQDLVNTKDAVQLARKIELLRETNLNDEQASQVAKIVANAQNQQIENKKKLNEQTKLELELKQKLATIELENVQRTKDSEIDIINEQQSEKVSIYEEANNQILENENVFNIEMNKLRLKALDDAKTNLNKLYLEKENKLILDAIQQKDAVDNSNELDVIKTKKKEQIDNDYKVKSDKNERERQKGIDELNKKELLSEKEIDKKKLEIRNARIEQENKIVQDLLSTYTDYLNKRADREQRYLDYNLQKRQTNIERQTDLASRGLQNQLAFEEQQLAKAELKRQQLAEEQARKQRSIELTKTFFNFLNSELQKPNSNGGTAIANAIGQTALSASAGSLAGSFFEGTENVERDLQGNKVHNGVDGYQIRVHGKERVMDEIDNMKTGYMSNEDLANLAYDYRMGNLLPLSQINEASNNIQKGTAQNIYSSLLLQKQDKTNMLLEELIAKPVQQVHVDSFSNLVETIQSNTEKVVITHKTNLRPRIK
jgi:hypothetical protein